MRVACIGTGEPHPGASDSLILPELSSFRIAQGAVRDHDLMRGEGAGVCAVDIRLGAEERNLKSQRLATRPVQPTRYVPPLGPEVRVAAQISRKADGPSRGDRRVCHLRESERCPAE